MRHFKAISPLSFVVLLFACKTSSSLQTSASYNAEEAPQFTEIYTLKKYTPVETTDYPFYGCVLPTTTVLDIETKTEFTDGEYAITLKKIPETVSKAKELPSNPSLGRESQNNSLESKLEAVTKTNVRSDYCNTTDEFLSLRTLRIRRSSIETTRVKIEPKIVDSGKFDAYAAANTRGINPGQIMALPRATNGEYYIYGKQMYGTAITILRIQELARRVFKKTGLPIYVGDISARHMANTGGHRGHKTGKEIDIGVMGNTPTRWVGDFSSPGSNVKATQTLVSEAFAMGGVRNIGYDDPRIKGVVYFGGHRDHLHINWDAN